MPLGRDGNSVFHNAYAFADSYDLVDSDGRWVLSFARLGPFDFPLGFARGFGGRLASRPSPHERAQPFALATSRIPTQ